MRRGLAVPLALGIALAVPAHTAAYEILDTGDMTGNGVTDSWVLDDNGDGFGDRLLVDGNEDGSAEIVMYITPAGKAISMWVDSNLDGIWDVAIVPYYADGGTGAQTAVMVYRDADQNGAWENAYYDEDLDGAFEWVMVDTDYDGTADTWRGSVAAPPRSVANQLSESLSAQIAFRTLVNIGWSPFQPVSIPLH